MPPGRGHTPDDFTVGVEDVVIVPLAAAALAVKQALTSALTLLIRLLDLLFPILLQLMRFPLFTLRILGDGIITLSKAVVAILPVGRARRAAWREWISIYWALLRQKISYHAFEQWLHHAFENGMAWVFETCRTLTPRSALIVIFGAVLWLPVSFGAATLLHGVLLARNPTRPQQPLSGEQRYRKMRLESLPTAHSTSAPQFTQRWYEIPLARNSSPRYRVVRLLQRV